MICFVLSVICSEGFGDRYGFYLRYIIIIHHLVAGAKHPLGVLKTKEDTHYCAAS